jgi:hypothetical protein
VALARVPEAPLEQASCVLLAGQVLAADHQWARLHQLAPVFSDLESRVRTDECPKRTAGGPGSLGSIRSAPVRTERRQPRRRSGRRRVVDVAERSLGNRTRGRSGSCASREQCFGVRARRISRCLCGGVFGL